MKVKLLIAAAAALIVAETASAQTAPTSFYGTLGYTSFSDSEGEHDVTLGAVNARLGARLGRNIGVEADAGVGVGEDEFLPTCPTTQACAAVVPAPVEVQLENHVAGYVVGFLPVSPNLELLARVGYARLSVESETRGVTFSEEENALSYGAGAQLFFDEANGVRADYTRFDADEGEVDAWSLAYVRKF